MWHSWHSLTLRFLFGLVVILALLAFAGSAAVQAADPEPESALAGTCIDHLHNGGFEAGTFMYWTTSGSPTVISTGGHTGWHSALLGGRNYAVDEISQVIPCPYQGDKVTMHAYIYMTSRDPEEGADSLEMSLYSSKGSGGTTWYYNDFDQNVWWAGTWSFFGPSSCAPGDTLTVRFKASTDYALPTTFLVDDVSIEVCCPDDAGEPNDSLFGFAFM